MVKGAAARALKALKVVWGEGATAVVQLGVRLKWFREASLDR